MIDILYRVLYPYGIGFVVFLIFFYLMKQKKEKVLWLVLSVICICFCGYYSIDLIKMDYVSTDVILFSAHRGYKELGYWDMTFLTTQGEQVAITVPSKYLEQISYDIPYYITYARRTNILLDIEVKTGDG